MMNEQKEALKQQAAAMVAPRPEAMATLSAGFTGFADYLRDFAGQHFPKLQLMQLDASKPMGPQVRPYAEAALQKPGVQLALNTQAGRLTENMVADNFNRIGAQVAAIWKDPSYAAVGGTYHRLVQTSPELQDLGSDPSVMAYAEKIGNCAHCKPEKTVLNCSNPSPVESVYDQMRRMETGFHELAHVAQLREQGSAAFAAKAQMAGRDIASFGENTADTFAALMLMREYGELGKNFVQNRLDRGAYITGNGVHETHRSVKEAMALVGDNIAALRDMTPQQLLAQAEKIALKNALTPQEANDSVKHMAIVAMETENNKNVSEVELAKRRRDADMAGTAPYASPMAAYIDREIIKGAAKLPESNAQLGKTIVLLQVNYGVCIFPEKAEPKIDMSALQTSPAVEPPAPAAAAEVAPPAKEPPVVRRTAAATNQPH